MEESLKTKILAHNRGKLFDKVLAPGLPKSYTYYLNICNVCIVIAYVIDPSNPTKRPLLQSTIDAAATTKSRRDREWIRFLKKAITRGIEAQSWPPKRKRTEWDTTAGIRIGGIPEANNVKVIPYYLEGIEYFTRSEKVRLRGWDFMASWNEFIHNVVDLDFDKVFAEYLKYGKKIVFIYAHKDEASHFQKYGQIIETFGDMVLIRIENKFSKI